MNTNNAFNSGPRSGSFQQNSFNPNAGFNARNGGNPLVADYNGDGRISETDYVIAARQMGWGQSGEQAARDAFRYHDRDRNGVLDRQEALLARIGF